MFSDALKRSTITVRGFTIALEKGIIGGKSEKIWILRLRVLQQVIIFQVLLLLPLFPEHPHDLRVRPVFLLRLDWHVSLITCYQCNPGSERITGTTRTRSTFSRPLTSAPSSFSPSVRFSAFLSSGSPYSIWFWWHGEGLRTSRSLANLLLDSTRSLSAAGEIVKRHCVTVSCRREFSTENIYIFL